MENRSFSEEGRNAAESGDYARALRIHVKRRAATQTAKPFAACVLAEAVSFVYANGAICCTTRDHRLLFVDLRGAKATQWSLSFRELFSQMLLQFHRGFRYRFRPIHHAHDIVSCLYSVKPSRTSIAQHCVFILDARSRKVISTRVIDQPHDLWVRNDSRYLYVAQSTETDDEGSRAWQLSELNLRTKHWCPVMTTLSKMPLGDLGSQNIFEVHGGFLYGASNRIPVDRLSERWNSFYYVFRFPMGDPDKAEVMQKPDLWRRKPSDGNIDDRWGSLRFFQDEVSGEMYLYESRREQTESNPQGQRRCYRKRLVFNGPSAGGPPGASFEPPGWEGEAFEEDIPDIDIHRGDDWQRDTTYSIRQAPIRTYIPSCRTFLDLVTGPDEDIFASQRFRLRVKPRTTDHECPSMELKADVLEDRHSVKQDADIAIWPLASDSELPPARLEYLNAIISPAEPLGQVTWYGDDKHLVYAVNTWKRGQAKNVVLLSFDPSLHIPNLKTWHEIGDMNQSHVARTGRICKDGCGVFRGINFHAQRCA